MRRFLMLAALGAALVFSPAAHASETVLVKVNGLVCDFCAQGIQKVFGKKDEVQKVNVNLTEKLVTINFKPKKTMSDDAIKELITGNGFTVVGIERN
jgi:copper chaperone CopZ